MAVSVTHSPQLGTTTTLAMALRCVALHSIPQGNCLAVCGGTVGCAVDGECNGDCEVEPFGAVVALWLLPRHHLNNKNDDNWMKHTLTFVAGIMILMAVQNCVSRSIEACTSSNQISNALGDTGQCRRHVSLGAVHVTSSAVKF